MTIEEAEKLACSRLGKKRYQHTLNVRDTAVALAKQYGANPEKAALAALLHDTCKELDKEEQLRILHDNAIISDNAENRPQPVWHGICAAIVAEKEWGVTDQEVLSAIRKHTTAAPEMSLLDIIIYMADMTSAERDYPEVYELRRLEQQDIRLAFSTALQMSLQWLKQSGKPIDEVTRQTAEAYPLPV